MKHDVKKEWERLDRIEVDFDIDPVPCPRPRVSKHGVYYGDKYSQFKKTMDILMLQQRDNIWFLDGPLMMRIYFDIPMPKSWTDKKKMQRRDKEHYEQTPDLDNLTKSIKDCFTGKAYMDDCQVAAMLVKKFWAERGRIQVEVERMGGNRE